MKCRRCKTELRSDDEFCYRCGERTTIFQRMVASRMFFGSVIAIIFAILLSVTAWLVLTDRLEISRFFQKEETPIAENNNKNGTEEPDFMESEAPLQTETPKPSATPYVFKPSDVTGEMKKEAKGLLSRIRPFLAFSASFYADGSHAFKWDDVSATVLAMYELRNGDKKIQTGDSFASIKKKVKKEMKDVFGKAYRFDLTYGGTYPDYVYVRSGDTVIYNAVGIYGKTYRMEMEKAIEYKERRYRIIVRAYLVNKTSGQKGDMQKYTLWIKDNEESRYGFTIDKVRLFRKGDQKVSKK